jgi:histidinol-phosphate aminotransferase
MTHKPVQLKLNELPFAPDDDITAAAIDAVRHGNRYPEFDSAKLRAALAQHVGVPVDWVAVGTGSAGVIQQIAIASGQGDIAFGWPSFDAFPEIAKGMRMAVHKVALKGGAVDLDKLLAAVTPSTTVLIICTPNTPTGGILMHDELAAFMEKLPKHVVAIIDEAYGEFVRDPQAVRALELVQQYPNAILTRTFSKAYGLAGFRVGYAIAQPQLAQAVRQAGIFFAVPLPAQAAALTALKHTQAAAKRVETVIAERERMAQLLRKQGATVMASHANFVWLPVGKLAAKLADALAALDVLIKVFPGEGVRITVGTADETDALIDAYQQLPSYLKAPSE